MDEQMNARAARFSRDALGGLDVDRAKRLRAVLDIKTDRVDRTVRTCA